ncbi:hypothetical protein ACIP98_29930 [Streptomyces sp. NPDC088354]|uniref:hypothetical protein n=1 Tax=unclassified Streptomyces TaxID=2593676 RepID=UPI0029ABE93B|nr:hypothetical protein [Streptomyces sp. MI02-7b]MDX3073116.1 hypothetical protein [Streptomyces sp. MI02-7b]
MRITRTTSALIAAAVCGSLTMGLTGGVASAHAPVRITAVHLARAADAAETGRADLIAKLGDTLSIGAKLTQEAQAQAPDSAKLEELRQGLEEATQQLSTVVDQSAASADPSAADPSQADPSVQVPADPAADPQPAGAAVPADGSERAADPVTDVQNQLNKLVDDVAALVKAVLAKDLAAVTAGVTTVVADLQALLLSVPKLLTGALPLPIPLPLDDQSAQDPAAVPQAPEMPAVPMAPASQVQ